jgi:glucokinase
MADTIGELVAEASLNVSDIARVGLGSPGTMDIPAGMLLEPHNLPGWYNFPIRDRLALHCGRPVTFVNDANAAAYGEYWVGSGSELSSMVLFTLGTGVGCGVIMGDLLIEGENSHGAECGHIIIDYRDDARLCGCGQRGHLEAYASATGVIRRTEEALSGQRESSLRRWIASGEWLTPKLLAEEAEAGDALALELILETASYVGIGAVTLMHTIDPSGVVLGGAMTFGGHATPLGRRFLERVRAEVQARAFPVLAERVRIDYASLGGDAGYLGAAGVARLAQQRQSVKHDA